MKSPLLPAAFLAIVLAAPLAARQGTPAQTGDAARGARLYQETGCFACHGTVGHGGAWQGPRLAPDPLPYAALLAQLREPARSMPRYSAAVLSDAEVADIDAYLRSIPRNPPADRIELLNR
jgi:mono/diheme cytochrome c family protein